MQKVKFFAEVAKSTLTGIGVLKLDRIALFETYIAGLPIGQRVELTVEKESEETTNLQYAYLFGVVVAMTAESLGYMKDEMIGVFKRKLLTKFPDTDREYVQSLTELNREEIAKFIDGCVMLSAQVGVVVPPPSKTWRK